MYSLIIKVMSLEHILFIIGYISLAFILAFLLRKLNHKAIHIIMIILSAFFIFCESFKLIRRIKANSNPSSWMYFPICALFVPSLTLSSLNIKHLKKFGLAFLAFGCLVGGICYITYPGGGIIDYPLFDPRTIYRTFYHFSMTFLSLLILMSKYYQPKLKDIFYYMTFALVAVIPCYILNSKYGTNLLFLDNPIGAPILDSIYQWNPTVYSIGAGIFICSIFYIVVFYLYKLVCLLVQKNKKKIRGSYESN